MSTCPDCGRKNVQHPEGRIMRCGRRAVAFDVSDDWKVRMSEQERCKKAAERRGYTAEQWSIDDEADQNGCRTYKDLDGTIHIKPSKT